MVKNEKCVKRIYNFPMNNENKFQEDIFKKGGSRAKFPMNNENKLKWALLIFLVE